MIISKKLILTATFLIASFFQGLCTNDHTLETADDEAEAKTQSEPTEGQLPVHHQQRSQKYSSRILGDRYAPTDKVFGIRTFPVRKTNIIDELIQKKPKVPSQTERVLDFRILNTKNNEAEDNIKSKIENNKKNRSTDIATAAAGGGKPKKDTSDEEEKTLAQQVADGKYGLIQNELFSNGSKRPGILSYKSNKEVPKDTKENLGGLEKDEIWLAEDHILVLKGGNYQDIKDNDSPTTPVWPPIDDYEAPNRQVKIPSNPDIPPPFPVQLTEDGPIEFIKGKNNPSFLPPIPPSLPSFTPNTNKTNLPFYIPPLPPFSEVTNKSFGVPPPILPPFLSNLPPGATFVAPPGNRTDIDEDDPSIYYPPKYDFIYPQSNTTDVPPGPLVPGIILPPPPDFFSLLENEKEADYENETDDSINSVTPKVFEGPKYLPALRKPSRTRISNKWQKSRQPTSSNATDSSSTETFKHEKEGKPKISYVYPENALQKTVTTTTPGRTTIKVPSTKYPKGFSSPIFVPNSPSQALYHPLPTTSPKPNHITLPPTTKALPKQILIITTPESTDKKVPKEKPKKSEPSEGQKREKINHEIHPLRSLIKPNVTVSYNGKYGHLPLTNNFQQEQPETDVKIIRGHYVTLPPVTKVNKVPTTDLNSIIVTPVPIVKKVRVQSVTQEKEKVETTPTTPSKATFYFYEEPTTTPPEKPSPKPVQAFVETPIVKNQPSPPSNYYYTTKTPIKTPVRQFLEETFHSSNVLSRKPQIGHINNAEIITHTVFSDLPKMKHLNYGIQISSPRPTIKYHYVTEGNTVLIPSPKIKDLEIKNSGSSGFQTVHLDAAPVGLTPKPIATESFLESAQQPEAQKTLSVPQEETSKPEYDTANGPFIPSNYYVTSRPEHIHFTSQEQTFVDDITKNYFTIFGQKINSPSTTPLTPIKSESKKNKTAHESGLTYISDDGHNFKIQQVHDTSLRNFGKPTSTSTLYNQNFKGPSTQPPSNFEKYLKELTGEDQREYIVSGVFPAKIKKGKVLIGPTGETIPSHLLDQNSFVIHKTPTPVPGGSRPKYFYQPHLYTTLRPVVNVEIKPHYVKHTSSTAKPLSVYQPQILPQNVHVSPNSHQYHQEVTGFTSPTTSRPIKIKKPNGQFFQNTPSPIVLPESDSRPKPISLEDDILVNYKLPRPSVEPQAELINIQPPFDNIKIVKSPDLSQKPNQPYSARQIPFGVAKDFFQSLPQSGYFTQSQPTGGNSFVSYNLPGNGGHFYFLTPQIVEEKNGPEQQDNRLRRINRSDRKTIQRNAGSVELDYRRSAEQHNLTPRYSSSDHLRRKKP